MEAIRPFGRTRGIVGERGAVAGDAVRSVHRAFALLALFSPEQPSATLTRLAQQSGLAMSTVSRLMTTLEAMRFARRLDNGAWSLGVRILQLGAAARETFDLIGVAEPVLDDINRATGENTNLAIRLDHESFSYIRQVMSRHSVRHASWVGRTQPLKGTANGAVLLGKVPRAGYVATRKTVEPDISAVAAPVYGPGSEVIASLSVTAPTYRMTEQKLTRCARLVVDGARGLSHALSGSGPAVQPLRRADAASTAMP
jgi:IclR family transcriptional regulator, acetate operon repressor